jgi:hypothetical protein
LLSVVSSLERELAGVINLSDAEHERPEGAQQMADFLAKQSGK